MARSQDSAAARLKRIWRTMLRELIPEVTAGRHVPFRAQVLSVQAVGAGRSDDLTPRYVATVRPLMPDGTRDARKPDLAGVAIQALWVGPGGAGFYRLPSPGAIVRVEYDYGDPSCPVIVGTLAAGQQVPDVAVEETVLQTGPEGWIRTAPDGSIEMRVPAGSTIAAGNGTKELLTVVDGIIGQAIAIIDTVETLSYSNGGGPTGPASNAVLLDVQKIQLQALQTDLAQLKA